MRRGLILLVCAVCLCGSRSVADDPKTPQGEATPKLKLTADEQAILDLTNKARADNKLPPLKPNALLFQAARAHSENMAKQDKLAHELDGKRVGDRVTAAGYKWHEVAENVAASDVGTPEEIVNGWLKSEGHRKNLLNPALTEIGLGVAKKGEGDKYFTQVFAAPAKK
jgi:uncharacterized protein YkwD